MKTVVISSNDNDDYLFFVPIVAWAWKKLGWNVHCVYTGDVDSEKWKLIKSLSPELSFSFIDKAEGVRNETLTQLSRLYAYKYISKGYIMTSDVDMLPLTDYWIFDENKITSWGRDLSDVHFPICYIGANRDNWDKIMEGGNIGKDLLAHPKYRSSEWSEWWQVDQDIITEKLNKHNVVRIDRGVAPNTHYPLGRVDRGDWVKTHNQPLRIDAHLLRPGYISKNYERIIFLLIENLVPSESDLLWMREYPKKYLAL